MPEPPRRAPSADAPPSAATAGSGANLSLDASPAPLPSLAPPQQADEIGRLGPFRVLKLLGQGGMGAVYLAEDAKLKRRVALKVMRPEVAVNPQARARFLREAQ